MLFWISVIILILGIVCLIVYNNTYAPEWIDALGTCLTAFGAGAVIISSLFIAFSYIGLDGRIAQNEARYESLTYQ